MVLMVLIDRYFDSTQEIYPGLGLAVMFGIASYFIMPKLISHFDVCMKNERYFQVVGYLNSFLITFFIYHNRTEILSDCAPFPGGPALAGVLMVGIFFEVVLVFFVTDRVTKFLV